MDIQQRRPQRGGERPFDQRFLLFAILALAVLMLTNRGRPPVAEPDDARAVAEADAPEVDDDVAVADPDAEAEPNLPPPGEAGKEIPVGPRAEAQRVALGSVATDSPYRLMLTIDNVGAGVERLEFSSENYRDLDDRSGYFGQLALTDAVEGGALVNVVGPGTPAADAGLEPGDVVVGATVGDKQPRKVQTARDLLIAIDESEPGQSIELDVRRGGESLTAKTTLRRQRLDLIRPEIENVRLHTPQPPGDFESAASFLVRLDSVGGRRDDDPRVAEANRRLVEEPWTIDERGDESVTMRMRLSELGLEVVKRFEVIATPEEEQGNKAYPSYHFDLAVEVRNLREEPQSVAYELTGPNGLPIEGYWYANKIGRGDGSFFGDWGSFGLRDVVVRFANDRITQFAASSVADGDVRPMGQGRPLAFAGVDSQYFASVVIPMKESLDTLRIAEVRAVLPTTRLGERAQPRWQNASCVLVRESTTLGAAGDGSAAVSDDYRVFAGPKLPELLAEYAPNGDATHTLADVPYYGWFGWAAKPMLWLLHTFNALVGNYGVAIILLTVCVRGAMFPISRQSALNMQKMQTLKPELDRITEKYGDDMPKRSAAQQELFRKHNYNPAAGCLPVFLQLPIFMGLYRALAVDVELRQQPLFSDAIRFCSNLAAPDMFIDWSPITPLWVDNGLGMFGFGPYFNLLPLLTCGLFLLQQQMFMPEPTNEQARLQQKMMKFMMLFMGLLFFKVPSGLCIYFIASSLWGMAERKMLPKPVTPEPSATPAKKPLPQKPTPSPGAAAAAKKKAAKKKSKNKKR